MASANLVNYAIISCATILPGGSKPSGTIISGGSITVQLKNPATVQVQGNTVTVSH